jgi:hypothetical protein
MKINLINLTPHPVNIFNKENQLVETLKSQGSLRLNEISTPTKELNSIPVDERYLFCDEENLPIVKSNTIYVVSLPFLMGFNGKRSDFVAPDTGSSCVRDDNGNILGIKKFISIKK